MSLLTRVLAGLLVLLCMTATAQTKSNRPEAASNMRAMVENLDSDIRGLAFLSGKIEGAEKINRDVLVFRRDDLSFRLLGDFEILVKKVVALPDEEPAKQELTTRLTGLSEGVGEAMFDRITEIKQRVSQSTAELESLSGVSQAVSRAYLQSLEAIQIKYYEALMNLVASRKTLGLSSEALSNRLDENIYLYSETLAGRIELTAATRVQVQARAKQIPGDADIKVALMELDSRHALNLQRLESMVPVLDSLGLDSSKYKTVLLQQARSISVSLFSSSAFLSVLKQGWATLKHNIKASAPDLLIRLLIFMAVLFVFRLLARVTRKVVRAASGRSAFAMSDLLKNMLISISGGAVMTIGILIALSQIGISLTPMLAGLGVAGFILGFALQDSLGNFAAGAMILLYRPYDVNDFIEVTGASGLVRKMNLVSTTIVTFDNQTLVVPNSKIWGDVIKNVTAQSERRVDLLFGIGYGDDIEHAERVLHEIVTSHDKVLKHPEPMIHLHNLGESSVDFIVRPWVKTQDYWTVYWDIMREVKLRFDREGISIPFPQRDVHLYSQKEA